MHLLSIMPYDSSKLFCIYFTSFYLSGVQLYGCTTVYPFIHRRTLSCFEFLAILNRKTKNICVQAFVLQAFV